MHILLTSSFNLSPIQIMSFLGFQKAELYWTKVKTLHLNCLLFIYKMMQASKINENVSEYSKTGLCITVKRLRMLWQGNTQSHLNVTGVQFVRLWNWTEMSHGLDLQKSTTNQTPLREMAVSTCENQTCEGLITSVFWSYQKAILKSGLHIKLTSLKF